MAFSFGNTPVGGGLSNSTTGSGMSFGNTPVGGGLSNSNTQAQDNNPNANDGGGSPNTTGASSAASSAPVITNNNDDDNDNNNNNNNESSTTTTDTTTTTEQTGLTLDPAYAQYVGQSENRVVDGIDIPAWVDDDYLSSYVTSVKQGNPRKPNMREMTEMIAGVPIEQLYGTMNSSEYLKYTNQSSQLLYGVVGSSNDTRDWNAITSAATDSTGKINGALFVAATQIATSQMYGGTTVSYQSGGYETDEAGNTIMGADGKPVSLPPMLYIVGGNGTVLTSLNTGSTEMMSNLMQNFGVQDASWVDTAIQAMGNSLTEQASLNLQKLKETYNPFANYQDILNIEGLTTGVAPTINNFQIISGETLSETGTGTETTQVGTTETQVTGQTSAENTTGTSNVVTADMTQQTLPQTVSYQLPQGYTGSNNMMGTTQTGLPTITPMTGTFTKPAGTGMMTTTPSQQYTVGSTAPQQQQQTTTTPQYDVRMYRNNAGMTVSITFVDGKPMTPIPSGFYPVGQQPANQTPFTPQVNTTPAPTVTPVTGFTPQFNMAQGGIVPELPRPSGKKFGGFKPEAQERIAQSLGYTGDMEEFDKFLEENPEKKEEMDKYTETAKQMAEGGVVQTFSNGGAPQSTTISLQQYDPRALNQQFIPQQPDFSGQDITQVQASLAKTPGLPTGATVVPVGTQLEAGQIVSPYSGQVAGSLALPTGLASTEQAFLPTQTPTTMMSPIEASGAISATANQTQAAQLSQIAQINAAQNVGTSVSNVEAAQGTGILMNNPVQRQIQDGELISGVANAETASKFNEEIQAATATPTKQATVQGQLEGLMAQFEGGNTPAWAAGSMRAATATMAARGLGASSLAGQAIIQAAMEAALPIAQMDAQVTAQFEQQSLSNRQQRAILAAQQRAQFMGMEFDQAFQSRVANSARIGDIANQNFTAEQQVALENSRIANTMNLTNLSNSQARVMAEAAALANMDMSNLNNRQQAAVQNAQNFLQADLTNLNNKQSTELFKAQQRVQSLFTDQAALNAAQQFNATSQNQTDQFFAQMQNQTAQFNASQANAQAQFNAGQVNVIERFNAEINNQRDQFNATNRLVVDQANAQWRRQIATADTAAVNRANEINAQSLLGYSQQAYNNLWQFYKDNMHWAWTSADNERDRYARIGIAQIQADSAKEIAEFKADAEFSSGFGSLIGKVLTTDLTKTALGGLFGV